MLWLVWTGPGRVEISMPKGKLVFIWRFSLQIHRSVYELITCFFMPDRKFSFLWCPLANYTFFDVSKFYLHDTCTFGSSRREVYCTWGEARREQPMDGEEGATCVMDRGWAGAAVPTHRCPNAPRRPKAICACFTWLTNRSPPLSLARRCCDVIYFFLHKHVQGPHTHSIHPPSSV